jgi:hypothetical protein
MFRAYQQPIIRRKKKYNIHAIMSHDNPRKKKQLPMQALPHTAHVTPVYSIYTEAETHLPTQIFTVLTKNTTKFNTVHTLCLSSDIPLPTSDKLQPTPQRTHFAHYVKDRRTDRVSTHCILLWFINIAHKPRTWP